MFWQTLKKPILALAPMAGITDSAFRLLCKQMGADVVYTEMISVDGLFYDSEKTLELLKFNKREKPIVCQLFGKRPELFPKSAQIVEKFGFDGIDINFGCPAKKVVAHSGGVTLMKNFKLAREIIQNTIESVKIPVSIKIRTAIQDYSALDFVDYIKDLTIACIMVHGRTYEQKFSGEIDYKIIKKIKQKFPGIVLANGGINTPEDAKKMLNKTNADGLGLARGLYGKPWLFKQIKEYLDTEKYKNPDWQEMKKIILQHAGLALNAKNKHGIIETRKHLAWYVKGFANASDLRAKLVRVETIEEIEKILDCHPGEKSFRRKTKR